MKIRLEFIWYDFWMGLYWDRIHTLYIGVLPMVIIVLDFGRNEDGHC